MFTPASFREDDTTRRHELIEAYPLGLLVTHGGNGLQASLLPFIVYPDEGVYGVLRAHIARANPHWRELARLDECLVLFQGAGGYGTPSWYPSKADTHKVVPTWNYATVHAWGKPNATEDAAWLRRQLGDLTALHERPRREPWSIGDAPADYVAAQMQAIVGLEIPIVRLEGKFKMSPNKSEADRAGVIAGLRAATDPHGNTELACLVERLG